MVNYVAYELYLNKDMKTRKAHACVHPYTKNAVSTEGLKWIRPRRKFRPMKLDVKRKFNRPSPPRVWSIVMAQFYR